MLCEPLNRYSRFKPHFTSDRLRLFIFREDCVLKEHLSKGRNYFYLARVLLFLSMLIYVLPKKISLSAALQLQSPTADSVNGCGIAVDVLAMFCDCSSAAVINHPEGILSYRSRVCTFSK